MRSLGGLGIGLGLGVLVVSVHALGLGCSSSSSSGGGGQDSGGGTMDSGGGTDSHAMSDTGGGGMDTGGGGMDTGGGGMDTGTMAETGGGDGGTVDCPTYCGLIQTACTGMNAQYQSMNECMNACSTMPTTGGLVGNTLACHYEHAMNAMTMSPVPHCWHAGPYGYGPCGEPCADFCNIATTWCSMADGYMGTPPFPDLATCMTDCANFMQVATDMTPNAMNGFWAMGPANTNTLDCREYHLGNAMNDPGQGGPNQMAHCPHPATMSAVCTM